MEKTTSLAAPVKSDGGMLDVLLDELAERIARKLALRGHGTAVPPRYATAKNNPLGSARAFLDAHRRGHFATFKLRREVVALWTDVETWIESRKAATRERRPADDTDDDRALLAKAGVRLGPPNSRAGRR
ncbi:hypothetical protein BE20_10655 [Sorangium cellulosum]|uniref:Uncharacterized protein n=1 Tax=Sorangium cellulosum TaxID=56 RepID=A0A150RJ98_SORCE|nr:hypothetical protein BE18_21395 [Sorangium cellulosum]KYF92906.1 hypothetical protein BE20_10655 [Sorangium cellulosum]